jgi:hypothetical protein
MDCRLIRTVGMSKTMTEGDGQAPLAVFRVRCRGGAPRAVALFLGPRHHPGEHCRKARRHGVAPNQLFTWRRLAAQGSLTAAGSGEEVVPASDYRALQNQG